MNTTILKLCVCIAWAGAALSAAAPANALAWSSQVGGYAVCSPAWSAYATQGCKMSAEDPPEFIGSYIQQIKFSGSVCNAGGACSNIGTVYTDMIYGTGRKDASPGTDCPGPNFLYGLGACAC